jgi:tetratricopeptide (TPR) repeat protein
MEDKINILLKQGIEYQNDGKDDLALNFFFDSLDIARNKDDQHRVAEILHKIAIIYNNKMDFENELRFLAESSSICDRLGREADSLKLLVSMNLTFIACKKNTRARIGLYRCLKASGSIKDNRQRAEIVLRIGDGYYNLENYKKALRIFTKGSRIDKSLETDFLIRMGKSYLALRKYDEAEQHLLQALELTSSKEQYECEIEALENLATLYSETLQYDKRIDCLKIISKKDASNTPVSHILNDIAVTLVKQYKYEEGLGYLERSLGIARKSKDKELEAFLLKNIGSLMTSTEKYKEALLHLKQSLEIVQSLNLLESECIILLSLGSIYADLLIYSKAELYLNASLKISKKINNNALRVQVLIELCRLYPNYDLKKAEAWYKQCLRLPEAKKNKLLLSNIYGLNCDIKIHKNDLRKARTSLRKSFRLVKNSKIPGEMAGALARRAGIFEQLGDYLNAEKYSRKAIKDAEKDGLTIPNPDYYLFLGKCLVFNRKVIQATKYLDKSITIYQDMRRNITSDAEKREHDSKNQTYRLMIGLLIKSSQVMKTFHYIQEAKAHAFLDFVGSLTKERFANSKNRAYITESKRYSSNKNNHLEFPNNKVTDYKSETSVKTTGLRQAKRLLNKDQTIVEYYLVEGNLIIWIITCKFHKCIHREIDTEELRGIIMGIRETIMLQGSSERLCQRLHQILISPVEDLIDTPEIIIIPHHILHYIPFQICLDEAGKYLIDKYTIKYLPSVSVIPFLRVVPDAKRRLLGICNQSSNLPGMDNLVFSNLELEEIHSVEQNMVIFNSGISKYKLSEIIGEFNYLHFICHSNINPLPPIQLQLIIGNYLGESGLLTIGDILELEIDARLVVLSACETGAGEVSDGDEITSLARAFLLAGSSSVIYSLWQVNDESTAFLMGRFYKYLKKNKTSEALRLAQLDTKEKYDHVFHWAPFVYTGLD